MFYLFGLGVGGIILLIVSKAFDHQYLWLLKLGASLTFLFFVIVISLNINQCSEEKGGRTELKSYLADPKTRLSINNTKLDSVKEYLLKLDLVKVRKPKPHKSNSEYLFDINITHPLKRDVVISIAQDSYYTNEYWVYYSGEDYPNDFGRFYSSKPYLDSLKQRFVKKKTKTPQSLN